MPIDIDALLKYWRNSLADASLRSPKQDGLAISIDEINEGCLSKKHAEKLFAAAEQDTVESPEDPSGQGVQKREPIQSLPLLIAPLRLGLPKEHQTYRNQERRIFAPIWIPAILARDGSLNPHPELEPWLAREFLEPVSVGNGPIIGSLEAVDSYLSQHLCPKTDDWQTWNQHAKGLFNNAGGEGSWKTDFELCDPLVLRTESKAIQGASQALITFYDYLRNWERRRGRGVPKNFRAEDEIGRRMLRTVATQPEPKLAASHDDLTTSGHRQHFGQMSDAFSLSASQRQSLHAVLALDEYQVAAINGPPGTGKTTLIQSIVASLWVQRVLEDGEPPVFHVASTNNRAVQNVLDSFNSASQGDPNTLAKRWLPGLKSYGLYFPATQKDPGTYQFAVPDRIWSGLPKDMECEKYLMEAKEHYLREAGKAFPSAAPAGVSQAVKMLKQIIQEGAQTLEACIELAETVLELRQTTGAANAAAVQEKAQEVITVQQKVIRDLESLRQQLRNKLEGLPWWEDLLSFLPPVKERRDRRLTRLWREAALAPPALPQKNLAQFIEEDMATRLRPPTHLIKQAKCWIEIEQRFEAILERVLESSSLNLEAERNAVLKDPTRVTSLLDRGLRHRLFQLAGRYWEGRWLLEMKKDFGTKGFSKQNRASCEKRFRRLAKITPVMISTLHRMPRVIKYWYGRDRPLQGFLDFLIVDEAGQVAPEIGAGAITLAQRAVIIGDAYQIEPIWGVSTAIDDGNLRQAGLEPDDLDASGAGSALRASRGSLMKLAQRVTRWTSSSEARDGQGLFLSEHRRCVPQIIAYCNELVYGGRLEPHRAALEDPPLPPLGWAHVSYPSDHKGGSRTNKGQARALADWLDQRREELETYYDGRPISELVGVVTPFRAQKGVIEKELRRVGLTGGKKSRISVGTVHTFQGGERRIILFSPVYAGDDSPPYFYDAGPNMLNVAVSRAKDSFIVFGDMRLFDPERRELPSGLLATHLFRSPDQEITDIVSAQELVTREKIQRLDTLEAHEEVLREALEKSQDKVLIVSPYLSVRVLQHQNLEGLIQETVQRRVKVCVVHSPDLGGNQPSAREAAVRRLKEIGVDVRALPRIHSKTLAVDRSWFVEGSFNWLSAARDRDLAWSRHEVSLRCNEAEYARKCIEKAWQEVAVDRARAKVRS